MNTLGRSHLRVENGIGYFRNPEIAKFGWVRHAFLTRQGGVSLPPYDSLNLSDKNGDQKECVSTNKNLIARAFGFDPSRLVLLDQMHQDQILLLKEPIGTHPFPIGDSLAMSLRWSETTEAFSQDIETKEIATLPSVARNDKKGISTRSLEYDAMITNSPNIFLGILTADCLPIFVVDRKKKVIAAIHAGRQGTVLHITAKALRKMRKAFGCLPKDLLIAIGPSIGPFCYEINETVFQQEWKPYSVSRGEGRWVVDLVQINIAQMKAERIQEEQIFRIDLCTHCHSDLYFSYRKEGRTGRQLSFIGILE